MVALKTSLFLVLVAFYNLFMDKLSKNQIQLNKANRIINEHMPDLAKRFFNDKKNDLMASSKYMYSLDISEALFSVSNCPFLLFKNTKMMGTLIQ